MAPVNLTTAFTDVAYNSTTKTITFKNGLSTNLKQVVLAGAGDTYTPTGYQKYWRGSSGHRHVNGTNNLAFSTWPGGFSATPGAGLLFAGASIRTRITGGKGYDYMYVAPLLYVNGVRCDSCGFRRIGRNSWTEENSTGQWTVPTDSGQNITFGARFTNGNDDSSDRPGDLDAATWSWDDGWEWIWGSANWRLFTK